MIRNFDELRNYLSGLNSKLLTLGKTPVNTTKAYQELYEATKFLTSYLADTVDSIEAKLQNQDEVIKNLEYDSNNYSARSVQLISDVRMINARLSELDQLKGQVDNLANIILRSLKDIPVKGGDEIEEEPDFTRVSPYRNSYRVPDNVDNIHIVIPDSFTGDILYNGRALKEDRDFFILNRDHMTKTKTVVIQMYMSDGDVVEVDGVVSKEMP